jgi:hypothetical protein
MALQPSELDTLTQVTLSHFRRGSFNEIITNYQEYPFFGDLMRSKLKTYSGGYEYQDNLMVAMGDNVGAGSMYGTYNLNAEDTNKRITIPERTFRSGWIIDDKEISVNEGKAEKIVDIIKTKTVNSEIALAEYMEKQAVGRVPASTDDEHMWGLPHWIVWASGALGIIGVHPSGFTDVAGLSANTYTKWRNGAGTYTNMTEDDMLEKWRELRMITHFSPPTSIPESGAGYDYADYVMRSTLLEMTRFTRSQNDNLGLELAKVPGAGTATPVFFGGPVRWVPIFDDTTYFNAAAKPIYGVNWKTFFYTCLEGWKMKRYGPLRKAEQPTVQHNHTFVSTNMACNNRRKNYVLAISEPAV